MKNRISSLLPYLVLLLLFSLFQLRGYCFTDSTQFWKSKIENCSSEQEATKTSQKILYCINKSSKENTVQLINTFIQASIRSKYAKIFFHDIFFNVDPIVEKKNIETVFLNYSIRLENHLSSSDSIIKFQLYYYFAFKFIKMKEYYYADKYSKLFLKNGIEAFDKEHQSSYYLNAMTISAMIDQAKNDLKSAHQKFIQTLDSSIAQKNEAWIGITKGNIGDIYFKEGKYDSAIQYLKEDIAISIKNNELLSAINSYIDLYDIYISLNNEKLASLNLDSAYEKLDELQHRIPRINENYLIQSLEIYTALGNRYFKNKDFEKASNFYSKANSLLNVKEQNDKTSQIKNIIQSIEIDKNINEINELHNEIERRNAFTYYFLAALICIILVLITYIRFYRSLKKINKTLLEKNEIIKNQNLELENINKDKTRLFSIISHDLRGPAKNLNLLFKGVDDKKIAFSMLEAQLPNILKNTNNLVNTLESILNWSSTQLKGIKVNLEKIDTNELIQKNIHFFEDIATKKQIHLINESEPTIITFDKNHFEIILRNLTSNAIKFSKPKSSIKFNIENKENEIEVLVQDEGTGMSQEKIVSILNNSSLKSEVGTAGEKGIGLGLILTKEFIELNGGKLKIQSTIDQGTTMRFTIPKTRKI